MVTGSWAAAEEPAHVRESCSLQIPFPIDAPPAVGGGGGNPTSTPALVLAGVPIESTRDDWEGWRRGRRLGSLRLSSAVMEELVPMVMNHRVVQMMSRVETERANRFSPDLVDDHQVIVYDNPTAI
jgi:hypothetical protein